MGDVLDDRKYGCLGTTVPEISAKLAEYPDCPSWHGSTVGDMARHIIDLKAEVVKLRAQKVELTEEERADVEFFRGASRYGSKLLDIIDRLCPPKAPPTDEELADRLDVALRESTLSGFTHAIRNTRDALRARPK